jgi:hypothetical protein
MVVLRHSCARHCRNGEGGPRPRGSQTQSEVHSAGSEAHGYSRLVSGPARAAIVEEQPMAGVSIRVPGDDNCRADNRAIFVPMLVRK